MAADCATSSRLDTPLLCILLSYSLELVVRLINPQIKHQICNLGIFLSIVSADKAWSLLPDNAETKHMMGKSSTGSSLSSSSLIDMLIWASLNGTWPVYPLRGLKAKPMTKENLNVRHRASLGHRDLRYRKS